jgi:hypothetical protein
MLCTSVDNIAIPLTQDGYKHFFWHHLLHFSFQPFRSAHPNVKFTCTSQEPMVIENLPFDKYEMETTPLTQFILAHKQPTVYWQVTYKIMYCSLRFFYILYLYFSFSASDPMVWKLWLALYYKCITTGGRITVYSSWLFTFFFCFFYII